MSTLDPIMVLTGSFTHDNGNLERAGSPSLGGYSPGSPLHRPYTRKRRSSTNGTVPAKPAFPVEHYCNNSRADSPGSRDRQVRRRPRNRKSSCTDSTGSSIPEDIRYRDLQLSVDSCSATDDSSVGRLSGSASPISDTNNNLATVADLELYRNGKPDICLPHINQSEDLPESDCITEDKNSYNSVQFRQEAEKTRLRIRHPKSSNTEPSATVSRTSPEDTELQSKNDNTKTLIIANGKISEVAGNVEIPTGASEKQTRLIQSKAYMEENLKKKLDEKIDETDDLISGLKDCQLKKTTREKVVSATKEVQNAVKPQIVRDPVTSLRSYKVNLNMGQYVSDITHVTNSREVTVIGSTAGEQKFTKEMKVQFPINVNMETLNVQVEGEIVEVEVAFKRWSASSNFIGHKDRTPETIQSIRNVFLGKGSLADAPLYKPAAKKEFMFSRAYGSTYSRR